MVKNMTLELKFRILITYFKYKSKGLKKSIMCKPGGIYDFIKIT